MTKIKERKIVIINQAVNYLTIGICNEFSKQFEKTALITGSIHVQGEVISEKIEITYINKWKEEHGIKKAFNYLRALVAMWYLLMTKYRSYEVFFISVPPMGYLLNIVLPHRFSMIIWDVYPDSLKITGMKETHPVYRIWSRLNKKSFKKAFRLFTIGNKMADLLTHYTAREKIIVQPIWSIFQANNKVSRDKNLFIKEHQLEEKFIVQYSGNIGLTHKVETMVVIAEKMKEQQHILFQIIGRGPRKERLRKLVKEKNLKNCQFLPFQSDEMFPYSLSAANLGVVILDEATSKGSVPSKSYNLMSYGIPSLYIAAADSELYNYTNIYHHGKCFTENEIESVVAFILEVAENKEYYKKLSENSVKAAENFKRENAKKFIEAYLNHGLLNRNNR